MTLNCSLQLWQYLKKRRAHMPTEQAAMEAGIGLAEARLTDAEERKGLLAHIDTSETPHLDFKQLTAPAAGKAPLRESVNAGRDEVRHCPAKEATGATHQEDNMARAKRKAADEVVEIKKPDYDLARRIYFNDIKPEKSQQATHGQALSSAYKEIKDAAHIQPQAAKAAFALVEMEESKRDDWLRSFNGLLQTFRIFMPRDLVDVAEGKGSTDNVVPIGESTRPSLATIPTDDSDLAGDDDATWRAGLKEGDKVIIPAEAEGANDQVGTISFIDGDELDVDVGAGDDAETVTLPRADVSRPPADDQVEHAQAAE
ncbi:hypothetical protein [Sphingomonas sp.]|uniref:hypothetical protein n=1 Tax=Sphingomonas sp. TaxID=28214 RepID=UPI003B3B83B0